MQLGVVKMHFHFISLKLIQFEGNSSEADNKRFNIFTLKCFLNKLEHLVAAGKYTQVSYNAINRNSFQPIGNNPTLLPENWTPHLTFAKGSKFQFAIKWTLACKPYRAYSFSNEVILLIVDFHFNFGRYPRPATLFSFRRYMEPGPSIRISFK